MDRRWDKSKPPRGQFTLNRDCPQARGLVAWYPMGAAGGRFVPDMAGKTHLTAGTPPKATLTDLGAPGLEFSAASGQYLNTPSLPVSAFPMSVSCWFNPYDASTSIIVGAAKTTTFYDYWAMVSIGGNIRSQMTNAGGTALRIKRTANSAVIGKFNHGINVYASPSSQDVWLNGSIGTDEVVTGNPSFPLSDNFGLGSWQRDGSGLFFNGVIGETAIWDIAISADTRARISDPGTRFELWYPLRSRKWFTQVGASTYTIGTPTYVPGSITSSGFLPRIPVTVA